MGRREDIYHQQQVSWFDGQHSRWKLQLLGLCWSYEKITNYNLVAKIKSHLYYLLNDSLIQLAAAL